MHILVTVTSKHGLAHEIAEVTAYRLEDVGYNIDVVAPATVRSVGLYDVVARGSAVYILQWMDETKSSLERFAKQLKTRRAWASSVRANGVLKYVSQDPARIGPTSTHVLVADKHTSADRYKPSLLSSHERSAARLAGVVEGNFRDWNEVRAWADSIAVEFSDKG